MTIRDGASKRDTGEPGGHWWDKRPVFRLHEAGGFDVQARPYDPDATWYDATMH